jgi:outer membrane protein assembly factor BamA
MSFQKIRLNIRQKRVVLRQFLFIIVALAVFNGSLLDGKVQAGRLEGEIEELSEPLEPDPKIMKKRDWVFMPMPVSNPTIGNGLGLAVMSLYQIGEKSPPSSTTLGGIYTDTESWAGGISQKAHLLEDRLRIRGILGYGEFNLKFFGIGDDAGDQGRSVDISQDGFVFVPEILIRILENQYFGVQFRYAHIRTVFDINQILPPDFPITIPKIDIETVNSGLGPMYEYDSRDNTHNPGNGTFIEASAIFNHESLGSSFDYQIYEAAYNQYAGLAPNHVLSFRVYGRLADGNTPFYDLSLFGSGSDLRGYVAGQYRDNLMLATQVEHRWNFYRRFGTVVFAGVGQVAPGIDELSSERLLPSAGIGLRFMASKENRLNVGIDYAFGRDSSAFYFRIGEAF